MGSDNGAAGNRQASAAPFPDDQRPNPARFALLAPASGGMVSNSFIHPIQKNRGRGYYSAEEITFERLLRSRQRGKRDRTARCRSFLFPSSPLP